MSEFKSYVVTIAILLFLNIFLGILIGVTSRFWSLEKDKYTKDSPFCLPCSDVLGHPDDGISEGITTHENNTKCCAKDNANLSDLIEAFTNNWQDKRLHEENPSFSKCRPKGSEEKPLLKLVLKEDQLSSSGDDVHWEHSLSRTGDLAYANGFVRILKPGLYYVYSQVGLQFDPLSTENPGLPTQHIIGVREVGSAAGDYRLIAKGSNSQCKFEGQSAGQKHNSTSFIGTMYKLQTGDAVSVRVYDKIQIIPDRQMNFFGMHMV